MRDGGEPIAARAPARIDRLDRLTKRPQFLAVASGRRFHTARVSVQGLRRTDDTRPDDAAAREPASGLRVGLTVTKRVGHATERNRIRRRLRAAIHAAASGSSESLADLPLDVVLVGRRDALTASFAELVTDLARAVPSVARSGAAPSGPSQRGRRRGRSGAQPTTEAVNREANTPHGTDTAKPQP